MPPVPSACRLTFAKASDPAHGSVTLNADGSYTYTPAANFIGADSFTYTVSDGHGGTATATVSLTVADVAPTASGDTATTPANHAVSGTLASDAASSVGLPLTFAKATDPAHGSVTLNADGSYTYTPAANFIGADSFTYTVSDGHGGTATATVTLTVADVAPTASGDTATTPANHAVSGTLAGDAASSVGLPLTFAKASDPAHGSVTSTPTAATPTRPPPTLWAPTASPTPSPTAMAAAATATVILTVADVAPTASGDTATTPANHAVSGTLAGDAASSVGLPLTYAKASDPAHGTVTVNADGSYTYTPAANFTGADSFTYTVSDGHGGTATATVTLTVADVAPDRVGRHRHDRCQPRRLGQPCRRCGELRRPAAHLHQGLRSGAWQRHRERRRQLHLHARRQLYRRRQLHLYRLRRPWRHRNRNRHPHRRRCGADRIGRYTPQPPPTTPSRATLPATRQAPSACR